ncbi:MAG: SGNH/GDSL hydrolase family protein [Myxococcales bacterium]|nr:SGNH/GDSL hydrolase family protein [Myxococcales bacterium]
MRHTAGYFREFGRAALVAVLGVASITAALGAGCGSEDSLSGAAGAVTSTASSGGGAGGAPAGAGGSGVGGNGGNGNGNGGANAGGAATGGEGPLTVAKCFDDVFVNPPAKGPNYDQFKPVVGSHCLGTNHQDITGVERVVFLGDSVTVGTPPTFTPDFYRAKLSDALAKKFGLATPDILWKSADLFNGTSITKESGAFASCSKWGARTDDLTPTQLPDCFPASKLGKRTLVIMTMGGNDLAHLTKTAIDGKSDAELWAQTKLFVELQREAIAWLKTPGRFPNGVFVVYANMYEFTDGTGEVMSCDVSALAGFDKPVPSPEKLTELVIWANEQFLQIAVEHGVDMLFLLESFCGHGFHADDPAAPCYRGPGQPVWFDLTCTHPNPTGHGEISKMFEAVVGE